MKNAQSPKTSYLLQFAAEIWSFLGPIISIQNLLIFFGSCSVRALCKIRGFCMGVIGHKNCPYLSHELQQRTHFREWTLFMMPFPNTLSHPIISQIHFYVTSHFTNLFSPLLGEHLFSKRPLVHENEFLFIFQSNHYICDPS